MSENNIILFDAIKNVKIYGEFNGSIIIKCYEPYNSIIFSDNIKILNSNKVEIIQALMVGFEKLANKHVPFSKKSDFKWENIEASPIEYIILISNETMELYDEGQFSEAFPYTINLLHTAGLYLKDSEGFSIDHLEFFQGEILKNPVGLIQKGLCIADRVVIDHRGDPVFYDCIICGRNEKDELQISYEPLVNVKMEDNVLSWIVILGIENLK
jgi:hypothetical protein